MSGEVLFEPLIPWLWIIILSAVAGILCVCVAVRRGRGGVLRAIALAAVILGLANPRVILEERSHRPDLTVILIDDSASMTAADRDAEAEMTRRALVERLAGEPLMDVRVIRAGDGDQADRTKLFGAINRVVSKDVEGRLAGLIIITDGQIHDAPAVAPFPALNAPAHVLLTGSQAQRDRSLAINSAPAYGIVGSTVEVQFRVRELTPAKRALSAVPVTAYVNGEAVGIMEVVPEEPSTLTVTLPHAGPTVIEMIAPTNPAELSATNNRAAVIVNGVRDRLRVLLVSGQPHQGERTWRNLLKSDPGVDLVHFTILRPPDKHDITPLRELALIVFPVRQLFEEKIDEFDLIIFDRYLLRGVLSGTYLQRVAEYVADGGALLLAVGPEYAGPRSLARTPLRDIIPSLPTGRLIEEPFQPVVTELGRRHPVTRNLDQRLADSATSLGRVGWGRWYRTIEAEPLRGAEIMTGAEGRPLLIVDRVGEGRVAQLMSDHLWLWARGYDGGGPYAELVRRLAHWLMREPDLEEERLRAEVRDGRLEIERHSMMPGGGDVTVTAPDGSSQRIELQGGDDGIGRGQLDASLAGVYRVDDGNKRAMAVAGRVDPQEMRDLRSTDARLDPFVAATGGSITWLEDGMPSIRRVAAGRDTAGRGWIGLKRTDAFVVSGASETPFPPGWALLILGLGGLVAAWWREGR